MSTWYYTKPHSHPGKLNVNKSAIDADAFFELKTYLP
jgi:hypothetical protein